MIEYLSNQKLEDVLTDELTIVDFFANWCSPCKMIGMELEELPNKINKYLLECNPDIVIITGHDAYYPKKSSKTNLNNYRNSKYFCESVKKARKYEKENFFENINKLLTFV